MTKSFVPKKIKFPTGVIFWLDAEGRLTGTNSKLVGSLGARSPLYPHEPTDFEDLVRNIGDGKVLSTPRKPTKN